MMNFLKNKDHRPKSILVETQPGELEVQKRQMRECGYILAAEHFSGSAKEQLDRGISANQIGYNAIFEPEDP